MFFLDMQAAKPTVVLRNVHEISLGLAFQEKRPHAEWICYNTGKNVTVM